MGRDSRSEAAARALGERHLALVGIMGAGKSAIGPHLAAALERPFVDSDSVIEQEAGQSIGSLFARDGEEAFRRREAAALERLLDGAPTVIATGGGAFLQPANRIRIQRQALSLWLRADLDLLTRRIRRPDARPLLAGTCIRDTLSKLMQERHPVYAKAHLVVDSEDVDPIETVQRALAAIAATRA